MYVGALDCVQYVQIKDRFRLMSFHSDILLFHLLRHMIDCRVAVTIQTCSHVTLQCTVCTYLYVPMYLYVCIGALDRVQYVQIKEGSTGHSYHSLLKEYLDGNVTEVTVEDPYIKAKHQVGMQLLHVVT